MFVQLLRYMGSLVAEPITRVSLNIVCRALHFKRTKIGSWNFFGPAEFIQLVDEAKKRLEIEDPGLLGTMTIHFTVIYSPRRMFSFPFWKYGGISDSFTVWKGEGVLAAWIYLYYHSLSLTEGRWFLSAPQNSIGASEDAAATTRQWLTGHGFPGELCRAFEG